MVKKERLRERETRKGWKAWIFFSFLAFFPLWRVFSPQLLPNRAMIFGHNPCNEGGGESPAVLHMTPPFGSCVDTQAVACGTNPRYVDPM